MSNWVYITFSTGFYFNWITIYFFAESVCLLVSFLILLLFLVPHLAFPTKGGRQGDILVQMPYGVHRFPTSLCQIHLKAFREPAVSFPFWTSRFKVQSRGFMLAVFSCLRKALFVKAIWVLLLANSSSSSRYPFFLKC